MCMCVWSQAHSLECARTPRNTHLTNCRLCVRACAQHAQDARQAGAAQYDLYMFTTCVSTINRLLVPAMHGQMQ